MLGSGWLLDLPFEYLRDHFTALYLIDIVHPAQIVNKTRGMENIHLVQADITGGAVKGAYGLVEKYQKTGEGSILDIACNATAGSIKPDYMVSVNTLNQLDILLVDYVSRFMKIPEEDIKVFRKRIQEQHINMLKPRKSCLISDIEERVLKRNKGIISSKSLVYADLPGGVHHEEWTWDFDRGVYNPGNPTEMLVNAIQI